MATVVEGDPKVPFSIAATPRGREGRYSFPWIVPLSIGLLVSVRQWPGSPGFNLRSSHTKNFKNGTYKGKGVGPFPTPRCISYRKGNLRVTLDYGHQLYLLTTLDLYLFIMLSVQQGGSKYLFFFFFFFFFQISLWYYLPTPPLGQDMTQGQFLSGVYQVWIQSFPSPRLVASPSLWYESTWDWIPACRTFGEHSNH